MAWTGTQLIHGYRRMIETDNTACEGGEQEAGLRPAGRPESNKRGNISPNVPLSLPSLLPVSFLLPPLSSPFPGPIPLSPFLAYFLLGLFLSSQKMLCRHLQASLASDPVTVSTERISFFFTDGFLKGLSLGLQIPLEIIISNCQLSIIMLVDGYQCLGPWVARLYLSNLIQKSKETNDVHVYVYVGCSFATFDNP